MPLDAIVDSASAAYLRNTGQSGDLEFILTHVDDLDAVYRFERGQVVQLTTARTMVGRPQPERWPHGRRVALPIASTGDRRQHARPIAACRLKQLVAEQEPGKVQERHCDNRVAHP
jgi:hypothetical protein